MSSKPINIDIILSSVKKVKNKNYSYGFWFWYVKCSKILSAN